MNRTLSTLIGGMLGVTACGGGSNNERGHLAATKFGDLTHPVERGSPIDAIRAQCGSGALTEAGDVVHRRPYLQEVTTTSATIGWVTVDPAGERAILTTPDGSPLGEVLAVVEEYPQRLANEKQVWARITGLQPDTVYCYALGNGVAPLSEPTGFRTAPSATSTLPVRFIAFGDSGNGSLEQHELQEQMFTVPYDLMVHLGDLAYRSGTIGQFEDYVFAVYAELFRNLPFFPASGNHEYETAQGGVFRDVFALPPGEGNERWYSYDWGRVHFAVLDTEQDYATQAAWLDRDLELSTAPWSIVYFHRPPYSSGSQHGSDLPLREVLAPVLEKHRVQLVLAGHDHHYERTVPVNGTVYVVSGGGGRGTRPVGQSDFTAFSEQVIHFVQVEVGVEELVLHAIDGTGVEFDSLVVPRT
ncbi:MAG: metallophosphoesterase family protein [Deltaproteobacteria bacterium]|nr:metallophosphoesterase family protein [Deltaproteobacteria bacterium]MDQ3297209.1 metallophosphoesterase family protein [Myxococcota bacterium]